MTGPSVAVQLLRGWHYLFDCSNIYLLLQLLEVQSSAKKLSTVMESQESSGTSEPLITSLQTSCPRYPMLESSQRCAKHLDTTLVERWPPRPGLSADRPPFCHPQPTSAAAAASHNPTNQPIKHHPTHHQRCRRACPPTTLAYPASRNRIGMHVHVQDRFWPPKRMQHQVPLPRQHDIYHHSWLPPCMHILHV